MDREAPRLHVRRSVTESGVFQRPKTQGSVRRIPIGPRLRAALLEHRMASRFKDDGDLIFPNGNGRPLDGHNLVNRHFRPTLKKAGLPRVRFHDLRHAFATLLLDEGVPVTVVSKLLGHASAKMTLDTYSHVILGHPGRRRRSDGKSDQSVGFDPHTQVGAVMRSLRRARLSAGDSASESGSSQVRGSRRTRAASTPGRTSPRRRRRRGTPSSRRRLAGSRGHARHRRAGPAPDP